MQVFFPIVDDYLLCFDLRKPSYVIIDHLKRKMPNQNAYGTKPNLVVNNLKTFYCINKYKNNVVFKLQQKLFCHYLISQKHPHGRIILKMMPNVMRMPWQMNEEGPNCGLYLMRHIECYMGEVVRQEISTKDLTWYKRLNYYNSQKRQKRGKWGRKWNVEIVYSTCS